MSDIYWPSWIIGVMSIVSFFFWWRLSIVLKNKYHVSAEYYFMWVILSGPFYGFMTWVLFTFLWSSGGIIFEEGWHSFVDGLYFLIPDSIAVGGGYGIMRGAPIGFVLAVLNFLVVQRKENMGRKEDHSSSNTRKKILKILLSIVIVFVADLFCVWKILEGDWGDVGGFLIFFFVFLIGVPLFKIKIPVLLHVVIFPVLFSISSSFYWPYMYAQYDQQFQPLRELAEVTILKEVIYQEKLTSDRYIENKAFIVQYSHDADTLEQFIQHSLDKDSLRNVTDFSLFPRENDSSRPYKPTFPFEMTVKKPDMVLYDPYYQAIKDKLGNNIDVLEKADYLIEFYYYVEPSGNY